MKYLLTVLVVISLFACTSGGHGNAVVIESYNKPETAQEHVMRFCGYSDRFYVAVDQYGDTSLATTQGRQKDGDLVNGAAVSVVAKRGNRLIISAVQK